MNCKNCGAPMADDATLCPSCGAPVQAQPAPAATEVPPVQAQQPYQQPMYQQPYQQPMYQQPYQQPAYGQPAYGQPAYQQPAYAQPAYAQPAPVAAAPEGEAAAPEKPSIKKFIPFIAIGVAAVAVIAIVIAVVVSMLGGQSLDAPIYATIDDNGAYIAYDGEIITINGKIDWAYLTVDREKIVVLEESGDLYWTDIDLDEKHVIASHADGKEIGADDLYSSKYFFYYVYNTIDDSGAYYRYSFDDEKAVVIVSVAAEDANEIADLCMSETIGDDIAFVVAQGGSIKVLAPDSDELVQIGTYNTDGDINLCGVTPNGEIALWTIYYNGDYVTSLYHDETLSEINRGNVEDPEYDFTCTPDGKLCVMTSESNQIADYVYHEDSYYRLDLPNEVDDIVSEDGYSLYMAEDASGDKGFFVTTYNSSAENKYNVYYIDHETQSFNRVITDAERVYHLSADRIIYTDGSNKLTYVTSYDVSDLTANTRTFIASGVSSIYVSHEDSDYFFYTDNNIDGAYDLYVFDENDGYTSQVATRVRNVYVGSDGESVFYFTDTIYDQDNYVRYGVLNMYNAKDEETTRIDNSVIGYSLTSDLITDEIDPDYIVYEKYGSKVTDGYNYTICYYDGKKALAISGTLVEK